MKWYAYIVDNIDGTHIKEYGPLVWNDLGRLLESVEINTDENGMNTQHIEIEKA